eukprot:m.419077 g.419077  ORF g.419077 m.419077 type:complete len:103 (+) comp20184_c0_seq74:87-395(+)
MVFVSRATVAWLADRFCVNFLINVATCARPNRDHKNILEYLDSFEQDGVLRLVVEYCEKGTLEQFLAGQENLLPQSTVIGLLSQMINGIEYIHSKQILHRDL